MVRSIIVFIFLLCFSFQANTQVYKKYSELGLYGGVSYYLGDLNPGKQFFMVRPGVGLVYRFNPSRRFSWQIHGIYSSVQAYDSLANNAYQVNRNLSFRSRIIEVAASLQFNFFDYEIGNSETPATPYIFAGLALYNFNPTAEMNGDWIELRPLGTEGQGSGLKSAPNQYSLLGLSIPFGMGFKFHAMGRLGVSVEWGLRKTYTDYLDDVSTTYVQQDVLYANKGLDAALFADRSIVNPGDSNVNMQRGNSTTNDWYSFAGVTLTYKLSSGKSVCAAYK
jgi:hypothetical protein